MLFDLRGRRKHLIRWIYGGLAIVFMIGFLGAGVGVGGGPGGFFDIFTGGGGGSAKTVFDDQINAAQQKTKQDPKNAAAWSELARSDFQLANSDAGTADDGSLTDRGEQAAIEGIDAWERYVKLVKGDPNATTAQFAAQTYGTVGDAKGALKAQQIVVDQFPDRGNAWAQLALFAFASGNDTLGNKAQAKAILLTDKDKRNTAKAELKDQEKQAKDFRKQFVKAQKAAEKQKKQAAKGKKSGGEAAQPFGQPLPGQSSPTGGP